MFSLKSSMQNNTTPAVKHSLFHINPQSIYVVATKWRLIEKFRIKFIVQDKKYFPNDDKDSLELYFQLVIFAINKEILFLFGRRTALSSIIQSKSDDYFGWCDQPGDKLDTRLEGFHILASFTNRTRYFVYVNETDMTYSTGYYYLFIMKTNNPIFFHSSKSIQINSNYITYLDKLGKIKLILDIILSFTMLLEK